jgi:hypothetical protein
MTMGFKMTTADPVDKKKGEKILAKSASESVLSPKPDDGT